MEMDYNVDNLENTNGTFSVYLMSNRPFKFVNLLQPVRKLSY